MIAAREPYDKTLTLLRQLRSSEETHGLPLLVMGPASLRADVLDCGSIDFLPTPVFVRDAIRPVAPSRWATGIRTRRVAKRESTAR